MQQQGQDEPATARRPEPGGGTATSPQVLRRANAHVILELMRGRAPGEAVTSNDLVAATSLTRATVLGVCDDLVEQGWLAEEGPDPAGAGSRGRPARRFRFRSEAGYVVGIDVGFRHASCLVADLHGRPVARRRVRFGAASTRSDARIRQLRTLVDETLLAAGVQDEAVLAACFGVAAPVDGRGGSPADDGFWETVRIEPAEILAAHAGWDCLIENDANLAALAERPSDDPEACYVVLLAAERFGAGIVDGGRLLHGHRGGSGEMQYLTLVEGVGSPDALALLARTWAAEALAGGARSVLAEAPTDDGAPSAEAVLAAAEAGDPLALAIADRLADRLARVVATLASLVNPEVVVLGGSVAPALGPVLRDIDARIAAHTLVPPRVFASEHGGDIVLVGAVQAALEHVAGRAVDLRLPRATTSGG
ncbi:ROK family protein [Cellulomonas endometrii]|uniref:ROK family protein n=1 Tax=Cellulomonas endometrii TaxID=3036301 RepID=UPI0024ACA54C|nr:ROK family protein [Cellulomonas endometrii]